MNIAGPIPSSIVILLDPSGKHITLDGEGYYVFRRFTMFDDVRNLINTGQHGQIDLHVPIDFPFDDMRPYLSVYIHTYFADNEETSIIIVMERQKIRDSIRVCCENVGEEFIERGVLDSDAQGYDEGINLAEQLRQMDEDHMNGLLL
jgi:hypothetical protein